MNPEPPPRPAALHIEHIHGDAFFVALQVSPALPDIPDEQARDCPQCHRPTWRLSRWCIHCQFDFDRASLPRFHPTKLLALSLLVNLALCTILGWVLYTAHSC